MEKYQPPKIPAEMSSALALTFPCCYLPVSLDSEIALTNTNSPQWGRRFKGLSIPGEARGPGQGCLCCPPKDQGDRGWQWSLGRGGEGEARWTCGARGWGVSSREQTPGRWWEVLRGGSWSTLRIKSLVRHGPIRLPLQSMHSRLMSIEKWETALETKP